MFQEDRITRIAARVVVAFKARSILMPENFNYDGSKTGVAIFNYKHELVLWAYPKDGEVEVVFAKKPDIAWRQAYYAKNEFSRKLYDKIINGNYRSSEREYTVCVWNEIYNHGFGSFKDCDYMIQSKKRMDYQTAKELLTAGYDLDVVKFYKIFGDGGEGSASEIQSYSGMEFEMNGWSRGMEPITKAVDEAKAMLPASLASKLFYGKVELKKEFQKNASADYNPVDDTMRFNEGDSHLSETMLHELGHRWQHKFMSREQKMLLGLLYDNCRGVNIPLKVGDVIECRGWRQRYIVDDIDKKQRIYAIGEDDKRRYLYSPLILKRGMVKKNDVPVDKYEFPTDYAKSSFSEFVSECFECAFGGDEDMDVRLKKEFIEIVAKE